MTKLQTYIVSGSAIGNWSVNVDATSPEDAKAQVEAMIDEFEDAPADVVHDHVDVDYINHVGPAVRQAPDPIHPTETDRDASLSAALSHFVRISPNPTTDEGDELCKI